MNRTTVEIPLRNKPVDQIMNYIYGKMASKGYQSVIKNGEQIWTRGDGVVTACENFSIAFTNNSVIIYAWIWDSLLGETKLEGWLASASKKKMKKLMEEIIFGI